MTNNTRTALVRHLLVGYHYQHIAKVHEDSQPPAEIDPRFGSDVA